MKLVDLRCERCGSNYSVNSGSEYAICPHCGAKKWIVESDKVKVETIRAKAKAYKEDSELAKERQDFKHALIAYAILPLMALIILAGLGIHKYLTIEIQISSSSLINKQYSEVEAIMRDQGFVRIECIPLCDLSDGFLKNASGDVGKVRNVTIAGKEKFDGAYFLHYADTFSKFDQVRIYYHSYPDKAE